MAIQIYTLQQKSTPTILNDIRNIFTETSARAEFASETDRKHFEYRYLDVYFKNPDCVFYALNENVEVLGYCLGSIATTSEHYQLHSYLDQFKSEILFYPAHLHINLTEKARGRGVGSKLLSRLEVHFKSKGASAIHLITSEGARNVGFYTKNGYQEVSARPFNTTSLLMLGKKLALRSSLDR